MSAFVTSILGSILSVSWLTCAGAGGMGKHGHGHGADAGTEGEHKSMMQKVKDAVSGNK